MRTPAREFVFVQSEVYLTSKPAADGTVSLDWPHSAGSGPPARWSRREGTETAPTAEPIGERGHHQQV